MTLTPVRHLDEAHQRFLYDLLQDRPPAANISHRRMPTWDEHRAFVAGDPYAAWYLILDGTRPIGAVYLTRHDEIGIHLMTDARRAGAGTAAVADLMRRHPRQRYLANVAPANEASHRFWRKLGGIVIQQTYEVKS